MVGEDCGDLIQVNQKQIASNTLKFQFSDQMEDA